MVPACIEGPWRGGVPTGRLSWRTSVFIEIATAHFLNEITLLVQTSAVRQYVEPCYSHMYSSIRRLRVTLTGVILPLSVKVKVKLSLSV
jgi:hypothetical protein